MEDHALFVFVFLAHHTEALSASTVYSVECVCLNYLPNIFIDSLLVFLAFRHYWDWPEGLGEAVVIVYWYKQLFRVAGDRVSWRFSRFRQWSGGE